MHYTMVLKYEINKARFFCKKIKFYAPSAYTLIVA